jgi:hypothetical protein
VIVANAPRALPRCLARLLLAALVCLGGCAGYHIGNHTLYPPEISTVYVPVCRSDSFRRNLGERLTEAIQKEIQLKTDYKLVGTSDADSILECRILSDSKRVVVEDRFDEPRELEVGVRVEVRWIDRNRNLICEPRTVPLQAAITDVHGTSMLVPEYGHSVATAQQQAITRAAEQIVCLMEAPW